MINRIPVSTGDNIILKEFILERKEIMQGFLINLLFVLFAFLVAPHIILLDFFDELDFRVVPVHDELLVVGLRVEDAVDVLEGDLEVFVFEQFLLGLGGEGDGVVESGFEQLLLLGLDLLLLLFELKLQLGCLDALAVA